jgi:hypothetical protein
MPFHEVFDLPRQHVVAGEPDGVAAAVLLQVFVNSRDGPKFKQRFNFYPIGSLRSFPPKIE